MCRKRYHILSYALLMLALFLSLPAMGARRKKQTERVWQKTQSPKTGLFSRAGNYFVSNGVSLSFAPSYYYGDVDVPGIAFNGGFKPQNFNLGGALSFAYIQAQNDLFNWRFTLSGGWLSGDNSESRPTNYRKFSSIFGELGAGIEYYPFSVAGLYLYGGVALIYAHIQYDFMIAAGTTENVVPIVPLGLGYTFGLGKHFVINIEALVHQTFCDTRSINLDGYPTTSASGVRLGTHVGNKFADGYFSLGLTIAYKWHSCPECKVYRW